ncbi:MAG: hypothetical protein QOK42_605 [Frankiaceae bacterium]|nr:hypothetical protein [Frankiaceae bacterium]MDX6275449.1 hypothetical protein [Frankiales bacterium]
MQGQLSFFSVEARPPSADDLEGLLAGAGQAVLRGDEARVSVVVEEAWRVEALVAELAMRDLAAERVPAEQGGTSVQTPFTQALRSLAVRWTSGALKLPPVGFTLDGARLRLWAIAGGRHEGPAYHLQLGPHDDAVWTKVGGALAVAGVAGTFVGPRADGPAYRVLGARRLSRLRELVGEAPAGAPEQAWPLSVTRAEGAR